MVMLKDGLQTASGFLAEADYYCLIYCRVPDEWVTGEIPESSEMWLKGFSLAESMSLEGDHLWSPIGWRGQADLTEVKGKKLQLRFVLNKAKVFGYRVTTGKGGAGGL